MKEIKRWEGMGGNMEWTSKLRSGCLVAERPAP